MKRLQDVIDQQTLHGAFLSEVKMMDNLLIEDENIFITVLVLLELLEHEKTPPVLTAIERALDFIEACEEEPLSGAFRFYPYKLKTAKLTIPLYADLDDSALAIIALIHSGRRDREWAVKVLSGVFENNRLLCTNGHPAWVLPGSFKTWTGNNHDNPVDCCVNLNVLCLYAYLGLNHREVYKTALKSVTNGLELSGLDPLYMRQLAPFYAQPGEVYECIKRAVRFGALELTGWLNRFRHFESYRTDEVFRPICCNNWGQPLWFSSALHGIRAISQHAPLPLAY